MPRSTSTRQRPLVVVDVDEVLAMFMQGFERFLGRHGLEMRIDRFALFQNIYRPGETEHLDVAAGRALFDAFFESDVEDIEVAPGAVEALAAWARRRQHGHPDQRPRCTAARRARGG